MSRVILLTRVLLKNSFNFNGNTNRSKQLMYIALFGVALIPIGFIGYQLSNALFEAFSQFNQASYAMGLMINAMVMMVFIFSFFNVISVFYFGDDIKHLLPMPFKPWELITAKAIQAVIYEYVIVLVLYVPIMLAAINVYEISWQFILSAIIGFLTLPIVPFVYSSIIVLIVMRFSKFFANKNRFTIISGLLAIGLSIGIQMYMQSFSDQADMIALLLNGESLLSALNLFFPQAKWLAESLMQQNILSLLLYLGYSVLVIILFEFVASQFYFAGLLNISDASASRKKLSNQDISRFSRGESALLALIKKEFAMLIRSSVYLVNAVLSSFLMPIILFGGLFFQQNGLIIDTIRDVLPFVDFASSKVINIICLVGIMAGLFLGGINNIAATAISREGSNYQLMKTYPISYRVQMMAKVIPGIFIGILVIIFTLIGISFMVSLPIYSYVLVFVMASISILMINFIDFYIGSINPKVDWITETQAMKQSGAAVAAVFINFAITGLFALAFMLTDIPVYVFILMMMITMLSIAYLFYRLSEKAMVHFLNKD